MWRSGGGTEGRASEEELFGLTLINLMLQGRAEGGASEEERIVQRREAITGLHKQVAKPATLKPKA